jgi:hypothetical protein
VLIDNLKIGYHAWVDDKRLFLFVLDDSIHNSLHYYYLKKNTDTVIAEDIGRSLHRIPGQNAMSFTQQIGEKQFVIRKFNLATGVITTIIQALPGQDQFCWLQNNVILMSDGSKIFCFREDPSIELKDRRWQPMLIEGDASMLKGVTRLAVNSANNKLAVVVSEQ